MSSKFALVRFEQHLYDEIFKEYVNIFIFQWFYRSTNNYRPQVILPAWNIYWIITIQNSDEDEYGKVDEKRSESVVLQEQLVGIINNLLQEQDNFRAR